MLCSSAGSLPADGSFSSNQPSNWSGDRNTVIQPLVDVCISDTSCICIVVLILEGCVTHSPLFSS